MKLRDSAHTYIPFIYLLIISTLFVTWYHNEHTVQMRPYMILTLALLNTTVFKFHNTTAIVKFALHKHFWKTCTFAVYSILINTIHETMFSDFHYDEFVWHAILSTVYIVGTGFIMKFASSTKIIMWHGLFLYVPIKRVWQLNIYSYILYVTASTFLLYSNITPRSIINKNVYMKPVLSYFMYLRVQEYFIWMGLVQLYFEYRYRYVHDVASQQELEKIIEEETSRVLKELEEDDNAK